MAKLAIKGHLTRGKEVIETLMMLGGRNLKKLEGTDHNYYYSIDNDGTILGLYNINNHVCYTLEKFLEKYPYKVGDKVKFSEHPNTYTISKIAWDKDLNKMVYQFAEMSGESWWYGELQSCNKEKTMKEKIQSYEVTEEICANEVAIEFNPSKFEMIEINGKYFVVKKQPKYPKTYEECEKILGFEDSIIEGCLGYEYKLLNTFQKLLMCRDAYWKIAGEQMGLGKPWKPNWKHGNDKFYCICTSEGEIVLGEWYIDNKILAFPTEEMRAAFYENFKELIEQCKELL